MWPSPVMAEMAEKRAAEHGFAYPLVHLRHPYAGHRCGTAGTLHIFGHGASGQPRAPPLRWHGRRQRGCPGRFVGQDTRVLTYTRLPEPGTPTSRTGTRGAPMAVRDFDFVFAWVTTLHDRSGGRSRRAPSYESVRLWVADSVTQSPVDRASPRVTLPAAFGAPLPR